MKAIEVNDLRKEFKIKQRAVRGIGYGVVYRCCSEGYFIHDCSSIFLYIHTNSIYTNSTKFMVDTSVYRGVCALGAFSICKFWQGLKKI